MMQKKVLIVSIGYKPNMGGLETHLQDLVNTLIKRDWYPTVLTYKPITAQASSKFHEKTEKLEIFRIPWFGNFFYKLVQTPFWEFIYLAPGLFLALPFLLITKGGDIGVIHSHGLVAGFPSVFWGKLFGKKVITTTHSIYNFPKTGLYKRFATWIFEQSDKILTLSRQSKREVEDLGINKNKVKVFTYWIDTEKFKAKNLKQKVREELGINGRFVVFCASRLVPEKGIRELLQAACLWNKKIILAIAGTGPLEDEIKDYAKKCQTIFYFGRLDPEQMPNYYSASDLLVIPSIHEEGFGRVILESLACGTPVIGSNRGAIPEAMDETVGMLININPENIKKAVEFLYNNPKILLSLSKNCRNFAINRYSEKNALVIIDSYTK